MRTFAAWVVSLLLVAGCGEFETRSIVLDLRVLAMRVEPPEIVVPIDLDDPAPDLADLDLPEVEVCALVADPAESRRLEYSLRACAPTRDLRCDDPELSEVAIGSGVVDDPEQAGSPVEMCGTLSPGSDLLAVLVEAFERDSLSGFGGLEVHVELMTAPAQDDVQDDAQDDARYAVKRLLFSPELPPGRVANRNPSLDALTVEVQASDGAGDEVTMPLGRCGDVEPHQVAAGETLNVVPVESPGAREDYVLPTFDGGVRMFTENLTYSWYATAGRWQREVSGGPRDIAGNEPPLDSEWTAPEDLDGAGPLDVRLWGVQRDERGGLSWYETCARVTPSP